MEGDFEFLGNAFKGRNDSRRSECGDHGLLECESTVQWMLIVHDTHVECNT